MATVALRPYVLTVTRAAWAVAPDRPPPQGRPSRGRTRIAFRVYLDISVSLLRHEDYVCMDVDSGSATRGSAPAAMVGHQPRQSTCSLTSVGPV